MTQTTEILLDKAEIIASFKTLPDKVSASDVIDRIIFLQKIEAGLKSVEQGNVVSHEEVMNKINQWRRGM